jgi:hypothetical protein
MRFIIYAIENDLSKKIFDVDKDSKTVSGIIETIKANGYKIGDKNFKYDLEFEDIISFNGKVTNKNKCLMVKQV